MQSLRTRKLETNGQAQKLTKRPSNFTKERDNTRKSRIDDKIKKRMSTRYATISAPTDVPSLPLSLLPGRPNVPQIAQSPVDEYAQIRSDPRTVDLNILDHDDFNADSCMFSLL